MLKIKLARFGKRNQPHYRIIVNEARSKRDGQYMAELGHYAPTDTPKLLKVDFEAYKYWISKGAIPTDTVAAIVKRSQIAVPFPEKKPKPSKKSVAKKLVADEDAKAPKPVVEETKE
ncbi:MAG: 30S ribosomal protein S16 [Candidatus Pacebacteria bacterium CG_4_10_14_0_8_um_filter_42_14]|nr:MAG: 30S ribosomal protein S16 [Candidatus Pacebacteria bacterium CG_4_10_14_0_8_um_filter_42_14]